MSLALFSKTYRLTLLEVHTSREKKSGHHRRIGLFGCACGRHVWAQLRYVKAGITGSCGCFRKEMTRATLGVPLTHGQCVMGTRSKEYTTWRAMIDRCTNRRNAAWRYYGGRGIRVCKRWLASFPAFLADVGPRPSPERSIDRIDNDGNYEPGNVRWATRIEQNRNKRQRA
jgi:hypothetical protein